MNVNSHTFLYICIYIYMYIYIHICIEVIIELRATKQLHEMINKALAHWRRAKLPQQRSGVAEQWRCVVIVGFQKTAWSGIAALRYIVVYLHITYMHIYILFLFIFFYIYIYIYMNVNFHIRNLANLEGYIYIYAYMYRSNN